MDLLTFDDCHLSPGCKLAGLKNCNGVNVQHNVFNEVEDL